MGEADGTPGPGKTPTSRRRPAATVGPGPGVDASGIPVLDPTANVLGLVEAAIQRQDDLRAAWADKAEAESRHIREIMELRAEYQEKLRVAESARIDAIRSVDVGAVARAAEVSATAATTLAAQVAAVAEANRAQVAATATQADAKLEARVEPIRKDVADLRQAQYSTAGAKSQTLESGTGNRAWIGLAFAALAAAIGCSGLVLSAAGVVITLLLRG